MTAAVDLLPWDMDADAMAADLSGLESELAALDEIIRDTHQRVTAESGGRGLRGVADHSAHGGRGRLTVADREANGWVSAGTAEAWAQMRDMGARRKSVRAEIASIRAALSAYAVWQPSAIVADDAIDFLDDAPALRVVGAPGAPIEAAATDAPVSGMPSVAPVPVPAEPIPPPPAHMPVPAPPVGAPVPAHRAPAWRPACAHVWALTVALASLAGAILRLSAAMIRLAAIGVGTAADALQRRGDQLATERRVRRVIADAMGAPTTGRPVPARPGAQGRARACPRGAQARPTGAHA